AHLFFLARAAATDEHSYEQDAGDAITGTTPGRSDRTPLHDRRFFWPGIDYGCAGKRTPPGPIWPGRMSRLSGPPNAKLVVARSPFGIGTEAEDDAAWIDLQDATEPSGSDPQIALDVVVCSPSGQPLPGM